MLDPVRVDPHVALKPPHARQQGGGHAVCNFSDGPGDMQVTVTGRQVYVGEALRRHVGEPGKDIRRQ